MTPEEIKADKRLQRTYGITLAEYNMRLNEQDGCCAICRRPPVNYRLNVDHDHAWDRIKIVVRKVNDKFLAECAAFPESGADERTRSLFGITRKDAKETLRRVLRRLSVRGLLCFSCNKGLSYYRDKPERFESAATYLRKFKCEKPSQC